MPHRRACLLSLALCLGIVTAGAHGGEAASGPKKVKFGSVRAFYFRDAAPEEMRAATAAELPKGRKAYALADLPLVLTEPCAVTTRGLTFRVEKEGLYRFCNLDEKETANVILYLDDLWRLAGHLSRLQVHGWRQDGESIERWTERARKGRLSISCGNVVRFVAHHLAQRGHKSRVVNLVTLEEHNHYDDGHVLMEVFDPREKRWILYDPDMKCRFRHGGRYLSLGEAVALYRKGGAAELEFFCPPAIDTYAEEKGSPESVQYSLLFEWAFRDAKARQDWYRRMMQVPLLNGSAGAWRAADVARIRATGYGTPVAWDEWMKAAYGK